jgi:hypothetical protein
MKLSDTYQSYLQSSPLAGQFEEPIPQDQLDAAIWNERAVQMTDDASVLHHEISTISAKDTFSLLNSLAEPSFEEIRTAKFIRDRMKSLGYRVDAYSGVAMQETEVIMTSPDIQDFCQAKVILRCYLDGVCDECGTMGHSCGHAEVMTSVLETAKTLREAGI